ncbi:MAG: heavy-metal-associated domain-containing protein [Saprospiraceae bacterium]|uniref:Heavy-metal-associated domain-containing protein n=1 Tax=Candidatus Opimibacter skivensis TaxID=2982028 RepID=A0A9D7XPZ2_9BACT|nr:heavy-metal-associated domain-containing protein [Candidatus Opimibacter skivensis]
MKKEYELEGMSCGGCVANVKRSLLELPDVTEAEVQLHPQRASISMSHSIGIKELQAQLSKVGHYTIREAVDN